MTDYIAIIGDIKASRNIQQRAELQNVLESTLNDINYKFKDHIISKFIITLGDEFQGVLAHINILFDILETINYAIFNYAQARYGIGIGNITTKIKFDAAIGADGPAYHSAREMITSIKKKEHSYKQAITKYMMHSINFKQPILQLVNSELQLISLIESSWSSKQREVVKYMRKYGNIESIANKLAINESNVTRRIAAANYYYYRESIEALISYLSYIGVPHAL
jgi:hypothetical protein